MIDMPATTLNGKWTLRLPAHRAARPEWVTGWEPERLDHMRYSIAHFTNPVVFDVGTEEGDMTGLYASWGATVHAFEPNPLVWPNIRAIWEANDLPPLGGWFVGFAAAESELHPADLDPEIDANEVIGNGYWPRCAYGPVIGDHGFRTIGERSHDTPRITIDEYVTMTGVDPQIITMDVEGSEWEVLKGAEATLRESAPILYISVHPEFMFRQYQAYEGDMHKWLRDRGYKGTHLAYDHEHHWVYLPDTIGDEW